MIPWLLSEMEKDPSRVFMEKELIARSRKDYARVKREGLLKFVRLKIGEDYIPCPDRCSLPCAGRKLEHPPRGLKGIAALARCEEDPDADLIPLAKKDLAAFRLNLDVLAEKFREANLLTVRPSRLDEHLIYLGETRAGGLSLAVTLGFFTDTRSAARLLLTLLGTVSGRPERYLVVLPSLEIKDQAEIVRLESLDIFLVNLDEKDPFKIDVSPALKNPVARSVAITLSPEENDEHNRFQFKARLPIEITGDVEKRERNIVYVGPSKVALETSLFIFFLRLVVELFKGGDGSVNKGDPKDCGGLVDEGILRPDYIDHTINKLRDRFAPALQGLLPTDFIEGYLKKEIRLSTHPRYVTFDKNKLLSHSDSKVVKLTRALSP